MRLRCGLRVRALLDECRRKWAVPLSTITDQASRSAGSACGQGSAQGGQVRRAARPRQWAKKLVSRQASRCKPSVILGWAPGGDAPFLIEAWTSQGGVNLQVPRDELPAEERLTIKSIVRDLELEERDWAADLLAGYLCQALAAWSGESATHPTYGFSTAKQSIANSRLLK